jgi:hypothetical protein
MPPMIAIGDDIEPGEYIIGHGGDEHTVDVDRLDYDQDGQLLAKKDGRIVAVFRWWDSIRRKDA